MSLTTTSNRVVATGDNLTTRFYFNRLLYDAAHLQVYLDTALQSSGYTVGGIVDPWTANHVDFAVAPGTGVQVLLLRVVPLTQLSVYAVGGAFPAKTTEKNFDLQAMALQQFDEILDRAVTLPVESVLTATTFPDPADPANYGMGIKIKTDGTGIETFALSATPFTSPLTTKGDLCIYNSIPDRLPVGSNGLVLQADSTQLNGVKWTGDQPDNVLRVVGSVDATKKIAFEVDSLTTATTRTITFPDYDIRLSNLPAGIGPLPYAGSSVPTGWLPCDGAAVSRTTYAQLFTAISTTWGAGDGATTFNVPNMAGRVPVGSGTGTQVASGIDAGVDIGANTLTVTSNTSTWVTGMAVVFTLTSGTITGLTSSTTYYVIRSSATLVQLATTLALAQAGTAIDFTAKSSPVWSITYSLSGRTLGETGGEESHAMSITELLAHTHTVGVGVGGGAVGGTGGPSDQISGSKGGNAAMNTMQPFAVVRYIISY